MPTFIALLRAVNVGGTGKLPMKDLAEMCTDLGFGDVRTYIQSGNVLFKCNLTEKSVRSRLEKVLTEKLGKSADVFVRTAAEMKAVLKANPFPDVEPAKVAVYFQSEAVAKESLDQVVAPDGEEVRPGKREIYIYFPIGMGRSKLKLPRARIGTLRNINTVGKLVALAGG